MQSIPGLKKSGTNLKLVLLVVIALVVAYFLAKYGVIKLPFKLPF